jgi:hypothetical protein
VTFGDLKTKVGELAAALSARTGRSMIADVTVVEPMSPEDELHFVRLTNWGFVYFNEAGHPTLRELSRLLKSSGGDVAQKYNSAKLDLDALRTAMAHNLPADDRANNRKSARAEAWLLTHGGNPRDWAICCRRLAGSLTEMTEILLAAFLEATKTEEDAAIIATQLVYSAENTWPVHSFDELVSAAAERLKLPGFDIVGYRKKHQERWRELAGMFLTREEATLALGRAIERELSNQFGTPPASGVGAIIGDAQHAQIQD